MRIACLLAALALLPGRARASGPLDDVPDTALAIAVAPHNAEVTRLLFGKNAELQKDLSALLTRRLGVDLTRIDGFVAWSTQLGLQPTVAVLLRLAKPGALKGIKRGSFEGIDLYTVEKELVAAVVPAGLLVGSEAEVKVGISVAHKRAPGLTSQSPLGAILIDRGTDLIIATAASGLRDPQIDALTQQYGIRLATLVVRGDGQVRLEAIGDPTRLKQAQALIANLAQVALGQLEQAKNRAMTDDKDNLFSDASAVMSYHSAATLWREVQPKLVGDRLVMAYQMPDLKSPATTLSMVAGIGAAVAIPAFMKYIRRSKTVEATMNVRRLADSAAAWAEREQPKKKARFAFPATTDWTPAAGCCGGVGDKCAPDANAWKAATWTALDFALTDPHYYQYRVVSEGRGTKATLTIEARGDLDCDHKFGTFKRVVTIDAQGNPRVLSLQSTDDIE